MEGITKELKDRLVNIANLMINREVDIIKGCRLIRWTIAEHNYDLINADIFLPFMAVESETDIYPLGDERKHYSKKYLAELDKEVSDYVNMESENVIKLCREMIHVLQGRN